MRMRGLKCGRSTPWVLSTLGLVVVVGCSAQMSTQPQAAQPAQPPPAPPPAAAAQAPAETASAQPAPPTAQQVLAVADVGFQSPESVLYEAEQDVYFVSNINGDPAAKDGNGFISKVGPDGKVIELKWIDGAKPKVTLDAPKGMGISGPYLYVSDINKLRIFDKKTGTPRGELFVKGATFLNDIAVAKDGTVYVTDTGWKPGKDGFENTGSDALFKVDPKVVSPRPVLQDKALANPNGIAIAEDGVWAVTAGGKLYNVTKAGKQEQERELPSKGLDGLVVLEDGTLLVSSWSSSSVYMGKPGGEFTALASELKSPADIGYDSKRSRLLVPQMTENKLVILEMPGTEAAKPATEATAKAEPAEGAEKPGEAAKKDAAMTPAAGKAKGPSAKQPDAKPAASKPQAQAAAKPAAKEPAKAATQAPAKPATQAPAKPATKAPATPAPTPKAAAPAAGTPPAKAPATPKQ